MKFSSVDEEFIGNFKIFEKGLRAGGSSAQKILGQLSTYFSTKY